MPKWVFLKLSNEIPCLTPIYIGTLIERAKEKSIPYKDTGKKKLTPLEDGQKAKAYHLQDWAKLNFKFHFTVVGGIQTGRDNMANTSNIANIHNGHPFVDLGLPSGLLWATCNVGATSPEQAGLYFAWGETTGYTAEQVKAGKHIFRNSVWSFFKKRKIKGNLTPEQDAAHVHMGGYWCMPSIDDIEELVCNCVSEWTADYNGTGVKGKIFTSKINGESVFFPAAGFCQYSSVHIQNVTGFYWLSNWNSTKEAWHLYFNFGNVGSNYNYRYFGGSVRGVYHKI